MSQGILVHEWLAKHGGSENVFMAMADAFPEADLLCLWNDDPERLADRNLRETWLARTPFRSSKVAALPLLPFVWRRRKPGGYAWALVSSHLFAHHVSFARSPKNFRKFVYVHSPARYIWTPELDTRGDSTLVRLASRVLRPVDRARAREAHSVAANSEYVRQRIRSCWGIDARVIYPPVDVERIQSVPSWADELTPDERAVLDALPQGPFLLGASRFIPYKRLDRVIEIGEHADLPVVLAGAGPLEDSLRAQAADASVEVQIVSGPSSPLLYALYERAGAFVFPAVEDFGIMPVEAHAAGCPTLVHDVGGAQESTTDGVSGVIISMDSTSEELADAARRAINIDRAACRTDALRFSRAAFDQQVKAWVHGTGDSRGNGEDVHHG